MIKRFFPIIIFIIISFYLVFLFTISPKIIIGEIINTLLLWLYYVFPSIFIFYIIATSLLSFNILNSLAKFCKSLHFFSTAKAYEIFFVSMLVGNPTTTLLIHQELAHENITENDAEHLFLGTSFFNPLFIITICSMKLNNIYYAYLIIFVITITNFMTMFLLKKKKKTFLYIKQNSIFAFDDIITAIINVMQLLINIAGIMVFCTLLKLTLDNLFSEFAFSNSISALFLSIIEITTGINNITQLDLEKNILISYITFLLVFQGISINIQNFNIIKNDGVNYHTIVYNKLVQALFSCTLVYFILLVFDI